jgi:deoxyribodipyrimidine photolyase-related protein
MSLIILFPHQLFDIEFVDKMINYYNLDNNIKKKSKNIILLWEHNYFFIKYKYHKMKLLFHRCTMKSYYNKLSVKYNMKYISNTDLNHINIITSIIKKNKIDQIRLFNPIEKELINLLNDQTLLDSYPIEYIIFPTIYFLNSNGISHNDMIENEMTNTRHDQFYKLQRVKYNIMIKKLGDKIIPTGDKWSFDVENRSPFNKTDTEQELLVFNLVSRKKLILESIEYIKTNFQNHYGNLDIENFIYPITHIEADKWLDHFIKNKLDNFGKYQDAISSKIKFGYHSLLSSVLNIGLITTRQILIKITNYKTNIQSKEAFIRQIIGWREYSYFTYDKYYDKLIKSTIYTKNKSIIPEKIWLGKTKIPIIDDMIKNVNNYAYSHHIERLMGIGNFLLLIGISPNYIYEWFQTMYIDAYDVFMIPNVYGMLLFAKINDKNHMMTRPYFCSSNYLIKMSDYKSSYISFEDVNCKWSEVIDSLYYSFIKTYSNELKKNYGSASAVSRYNKFTQNKKDELDNLANKYKKWLYKDDYINN